MYSKRTGRDSSAYLISQLEPHKRYTVSVKVISAGTTSEEAQDSVVTMIDRKPRPLQDAESVVEFNQCSETLLL